MIGTAHTLFEHEKKPYSELGWSVDHPIVEQIDSINNLQKKELIHLGRKDLRATQYVGLMQLGDVSIQVLPKIDEYPDSEEISPDRRYASAASNLMVMLAYAYGIIINPLDLAEMETQQRSWFEWLTFLFASELMRQLQLGVHRAYVTQEEVLPLIKGRWDLSRQFTRHPILVNKFDIQYSDFSANTLLNRVFMAAVCQLLRMTRESSNYQLLHAARAILISAGCFENVEVQNDYGEKIHFTRLDERFRTAYQLADLFLQGSGTNIFRGRQESYTLMFDMNVLFEKFVAGFLTRHKRSIFGSYADEIKVLPQAKHKRVHFLSRMPNGKKIFLLRPDILLFKGSSFNNSSLGLIIDTKYKKLDIIENSRGINEGDGYQMLAYSIAYQCPIVLLIYPQVGTSPLREGFDINNCETQLFAATINLHQRLDNPNRLIKEFKQIFSKIERREFTHAEI